MNWFHRPASIAVAGLLATGALFATAPAASAGTGFGSCGAQGDFAICTASGTATRPVTITVTVTSSPDQDVSVAWDTVCSQGDGAGTSSGTFTARTPVSRVISHPYHQPDSCIVAADAQLQAGGNTIHVSLSYSRTAPASPRIKGFDGKCVNDKGDSAAPRTPIQIWSCANNAAQRWAFTGGELKHGGMCLSAKGSGGSGSRIILWNCAGAGNQLWSHNSRGEYVLKATGLCLADPGFSTRDGTQLVVSRCTGGANQRWSVP